MEKKEFHWNQQIYNEHCYNIKGIFNKKKLLLINNVVFCARLVFNVWFFKLNWIECLQLLLLRCWTQEWKRGRGWWYRWNIWTQIQTNRDCPIQPINCSQLEARPTNHISLIIATTNLNINFLSFFPNFFFVCLFILAKKQLFPFLFFLFHSFLLIKKIIIETKERKSKGERKDRDNEKDVRREMGDDEDEDKNDDGFSPMTTEMKKRKKMILHSEQ